MARLLIVDDEAKIREMIAKYASHEGHETDLACNGKEALKLFREGDYDVVILDVMMPEMDGYETLKKMKEIRDVHCIFLTALGEEYDRVYGFDIGGEDYVTKPFSPMELMARIKVILSHSKSTEQKSDNGKLTVSGIEIDTLGLTVTVDGERADLTAKEYSLLLLLVKNKGIVLSRDKILNEVWGYDSFGVDRTVDWQIKLLRSKLGAYRDSIKTVRGVGYKFEV